MRKNLVSIHRQSSDSVNQGKLKLDKNFKPFSVDKGDEIFANGIFEFNVTKLSALIRANPKKFPIERIDVKTLANGIPEHLDESAIQAADVSKPIILVEISPGHFSVIDGNHRLEKARREGLKRIAVYRVTATQHSYFLISVRAYEAYIQYWNSKIDK